MKKAIFALTLVVTITLFALTVTGCPNNDDPNSGGDQNQAPTANAGTDFEHNISVSGTTVTLTGSGTDTDGSITGYAWTCADKPNGSATPTFSNSAIGNPTVSGFDTLGDYEFSLKIKDNENKESTADVVKLSLCMTASKNVEVKFTAFVAGATLDLTPTYTPAIAGNGFVDDDVVYTVTDEDNREWNKETGFVISVEPYPYPTITGVTFTQTFKYKNDIVIIPTGLEGNQTVRLALASVPTKRFSSMKVNNAENTTTEITPIDITLSKKVTAGAITTAVDTTVEFVELEAGATIDFSPSTDLPSGVTYTVTDDSTPQKKWELYKDGFNGKITASGNYTTGGNVIFTQTFYLYGEEIAGANSKRTVEVGVSILPSLRFASIISDSADISDSAYSGSVTLKYP